MIANDRTIVKQTNGLKATPEPTTGASAGVAKKNIVHDLCEKNYDFYTKKKTTILVPRDNIYWQRVLNTNCHHFFFIVLQFPLKILCG